MLFPRIFASGVVGRATNATSAAGVECRTVSCNMAIPGVDMMFFFMSFRRVSVKIMGVCVVVITTHNTTTKPLFFFHETCNGCLFESRTVIL